VEFALPHIEFSENDVTATYMLGENAVSPGTTHVFDETGSYEMIVTAQDASGNKATPKKIYFDVVEQDDILSLNKIYALDTARGVEAHLGDPLSVNNHRLNLTTVEDGKTSEDGIPAVTDEEGNIVSNSFLVMKNYALETRSVFTDPLHVLWNEKFAQVYFYVYFACEENRSIYLNFNNYKTTVYSFVGGVKTGWQKIVLGKTEKRGDDPTTAIVESSDHVYYVTDYSKISAHVPEGMYPSTSLEGLIDLKDCIGTFMRVTANMSFETYAMSAVYGLPFAEQGV
jgi:hypothetical protein